MVIFEEELSKLADLLANADISDDQKGKALAELGEKMFDRKLREQELSKIIAQVYPETLLDYLRNSLLEPESIVECKQYSTEQQLAVLRAAASQYSQFVTPLDLIAVANVKRCGSLWEAVKDVVSHFLDGGIVISAVENVESEAEKVDYVSRIFLTKMLRDMAQRIPRDELSHFEEEANRDPPNTLITAVVLLKHTSTADRDDVIARLHMDPARMSTFNCEIAK